MNQDTLLDSEFLQKLERLALVTTRRRAAGMKGERRSPRRGSSLEFIDFRHYVAGDDPRQVDWNAYGRSGNLFVKLFEEEEVLTAHLILDVSKSMDWGWPNKLEYGRRLAAALGYVVLAGLDRVAAAKAGEGITTLGPIWGRRKARRLFEFFASGEAQGRTNLDATLARYVDTHPRPGLAIVISDLLSPSAQPGIRHLLAHRYEVVVLHLLCPQEDNPPTAEGLRLIDRETGSSVDVYMDRHAVDLYQKRLSEWCAGLQTFCLRHNVSYQRLSSQTPLEQTLFGLLQSRGILR